MFKLLTIPEIVPPYDHPTTALTGQLGSLLRWSESKKVGDRREVDDEEGQKNRCYCCQQECGREWPWNANNEV